jgi:hypothetical protein
MEHGIKIRKAILKINPNAKFIIRGETIDGIEWFNDTTPIAKSDIETKMSEIQTEYDALEYSRKRKAEYPPMENYLDGIVKDDQTQIDKYIADCKAVKKKYPK